MKKFLGILVAMMLVIGFAGQASAYFEDYSLLRFVFQSGTAVPNEWGTDLGVDTTSTGVSSYGLVGDLLAASNFTDMSQVKVSYWAKENASPNPAQYWITGGYNDGDGLTLTGGKATNLNTATDAVTGSTYGYGKYGTSTVVLAKSSTYSHYYNIEKNTDSSIGGFANSLKVPPGKEATISLADLTGPTHEVWSSLYYFNYKNAELVGTLVAYIRTYMTAGADGDYTTLADNFIGTEIRAVPVPAAVWLLGSGLMALFGIRRKSISRYFA
ncbi:MAG: hypothetical protein A4E64_00459 [Syntrophorhabdus sp. PtaU1.Bin058]|nr:MAG: hypothetical protein A4E64_00459 [Syntrophorhabdus sp. PtaU1.Bin058]